MMSIARDPVRRAAVAGTWYPSDPDALTSEVESYLNAVVTRPGLEVGAIVAPHAGLMYSGPVAAHSYAAIGDRRFDVAVLVGPSHFVGFPGVSICSRGTWETPLGSAIVEADVAARLLEASPIITDYPRAHRQEHSLELQLPFLQHIMPDTPIVPLVMGSQNHDTIRELSSAMSVVLRDAQALLIASTDLSHYFDAQQAAALDRRVVDHVERFDWSGLLQEFEGYPEHERGRYVACGGGAAIAVMRTAKTLGATRAQVLTRADSAAVSGDETRVVGYLAAVFGTEKGAHA